MEQTLVQARLVAGMILGLPVGQNPQQSTHHHHRGDRVLLLDVIAGSQYLVAEFGASAEAGANGSATSAGNVVIEPGDFACAVPLEGDASSVVEPLDMVLHSQCTRILSPEDLAEVSIVGSLATNVFARVLRQRVQAETRRFYSVFHATKPFEPGTTYVPYAGRVFDHHEVEAAVDASLDFWLTLGEHGERFQRGLASYLGVRTSVLTNSGSSANLVAFSTLTSPELGKRRVRPGDEVITAEDVTVLIDRGATLFLIGTTMDYREAALESGFTFINPNEKGRCGCGESFHV